MPSASANGITIEYDTFGDAGDPTVLLVMGFTGQLTLWDESFCSRLADTGHHVVRYDNRDVGLSTWFDDAGEPGLPELLAGTATAPYSLSDMAADAAGLLDALDVPSAHVVGVSMGGMIAQTFAIDFPQRTLTLTSIMSTTGDPTVGQPRPDAFAALVVPPPGSRQEAMDQGVITWKTIGSPGFPFDEAAVRERAASFYDRAFHPAGHSRQLAAIVTQPDRSPVLGNVSVPTLVIHGESDPLVDPSGGTATATAIPGAKLWLVPGMGHDLPTELTDELVAELADLFSRGEH
jgi:pimeloyl-ACP methyl ester carboxylesterase